MSERRKKLMIIDGNALIHRSFHALPPTMTTKAGEMTNAVYGFTTVLLKALRELKPDYAVLTLDRAAPTFRHEEYKEYKATRVKAPDELYEQIPRVKEVAEAFNIPIYELDGFEADDLIGTIASRTDGTIDKIILTGDMDTLQLVNSHTKVYTMSRGLSESVIYDDAMVISRYGLKSEQMIDYKALRGDPSDNIPGVRGIGEKTATQLLKEFVTLDGVYGYIEMIQDGKLKTQDKIKQRIFDLLLEHKDEAYLSKKLATIELDAPIEFNIADAEFGQIDKEAIVKLFSELDFKSLLPRIKDIGQNTSEGRSTASSNTPGSFPGKRLDQDDSNTVHPDKFERNKTLFKYQLIDTEKKFDDFIKKLSKQKHFTFDTETTGFDPLLSDLIGISFSWKEGEAFFIEVGSPALVNSLESGIPQIRKALRDQKSEGRSNKEKQLNLFNASAQINKKMPEGIWLDRLRPIFENENVKKYGHNIKFDIRVMRAHGVETKGVEFDTMIASYLLNPGSRQHNLDGVTFSEFGFEKISKEDLTGKGRDKITFAEVPMDRMMLYSCEDADYTNRLVDKLGKELRTSSLKKLFEEIEMPLVGVLSDIEDNGIKIDPDFLQALGKYTGKNIKSLQKNIWKLAGSEFNISSTQQLRDVLFNKLKISTDGIGKTKTGISTAADELHKMKNDHEIIPLIQEYRELNKLSNTYIETLPKMINPDTKRVHTSFNQAVTATGRLSSTDPNLQNIPVRTELGREIRKAFIAETGFKLLSLDYSQIELRLAAHMSGDKKMVQAFKNNMDIHTATAGEINQVGIEEVTKEMRREAKAINFGIIYGQGPRGLSQTADIPYDRAKKFIDNYFKVYEGVKKYLEQSIEEAREKGYAETLFGRKRMLQEINSSVMQVRKNAERMAINTPLQGTAADMIKVAMVNIYKELKKGTIEGTKMLLTVHDELLFEIREDQIEKAAPKLKRLMENVIDLKVPVIVDLKVGKNWGEMKKLEQKR